MGKKRGGKKKEKKRGEKERDKPKNFPQCPCDPRCGHGPMRGKKKEEKGKRRE